MTREDKIKNKKERAQKRIDKRKEKDKEYKLIAWNHDKFSISWGRRYSQGRAFSCEMGYSDCEERGYCNGDC